jgi:hypothetical protein
MKRRMTVLVDLPRLQLQDEAACRRYNVPVRTLKASWRAWIYFHCYHYYGLKVTVQVRRHNAGEDPRWAGSWAPPDLSWTALAAGWLGALGHLAMLHGAAKGRDRRPRQVGLPRVDSGEE